MDILLAFDEAEPNSLVALTPIAGYLAALGYAEWRKEGLLIEGWPVQFLPAADGLDREALAQARVVQIDMGDGEVATRVLQAEHLAAIALRTGRAKDYARIVQLLDARAIEADTLAAVLARHDLAEKWQGFQQKHGLDGSQTLNQDAPDD